MLCWVRAFFVIVTTLGDDSKSKHHHGYHNFITPCQFLLKKTICGRAAFVSCLFACTQDFKYQASGRVGVKSLLFGAFGNGHCQLCYRGHIACAGCPIVCDYTTLRYVVVVFTDTSYERSYAGSRVGCAHHTVYRSRYQGPVVVVSTLYCLYSQVLGMA